MTPPDATSRAGSHPVRAAGRQPVCGLVAVIFFALHPAHTEPVQWITGRVDGPAAERFAAAPLKEFPHESGRKLIHQLAPP